MEDRPPHRFPVAVAAALLFLGCISNGLALSTSVLVDAGQAPYERRVDKTSLLSAEGCPETGCKELPPVGEAAATTTSPPKDATVSGAPKNALESVTGDLPQTPALAAPQTQADTKINKPAKKSHPSDPALVQPASQYHYYGGGTEERRTRNVRIYPTPMKRKYVDYPRLKRSVRLSPKEVLALLSLWERPLPREDVDDELSSGTDIPTDSSRRRYFKHEDIEPEVLLDDYDDGDAEYGVERGRESWGNVVRPAAAGRRYLSDDVYRNDLREARKRTWQHQQQRVPQRYVGADEQLEAKKRFDRLVQEQLNQLKQLMREDREEEPRTRFDSLAALAANDPINFASTEWATPTDYKRRTSFGAARNKPEDNKYHRWLQGQQ